MLYWRNSLEALYPELLWNS